MSFKLIPAIASLSRMLDAGVISARCRGNFGSLYRPPPIALTRYHTRRSLLSSEQTCSWNKAERRDAMFPCPPPGPACPQASSSIHTETLTHTPYTFHLHLSMLRFDAHALRLRGHGRPRTFSISADVPATRADFCLIRVTLYTPSSGEKQGALRLAHQPCRLVCPPACGCARCPCCTARQTHPVSSM